MHKVYELFGVRKITEDREIGIEIEMEGRFLNINLPSYWMKNHDGSLRGEGIEYILAGPCKRNSVRQRLEYLERKAKEAGARWQPSERCGVHIHINCQYLNSMQVINFATLYLTFEDILLNYCGATREGNLFCLRARDADAIVDTLVRMKERGDVSSVQLNDDIRYASMNLSALRRYGSIEFRALETPKDNLAREIDTWAEMLLNVRDASLKFSEPKEIIERISYMGARFLQEVFPNHWRRLVVPNIDEVLMESCRLIQDIGYTQTVEQPVRKMKSKSYTQRPPVAFDWAEADDLQGIAEPEPEGPARRRFRAVQVDGMWRAVIIDEDNR